LFGWRQQNSAKELILQFLLHKGIEMEKQSKIYVAGHKGMVGSAIVRRLIKEGFSNLLLRPRSELDLLEQGATEDFFRTKQPEYVFLAAAHVGGIMANNIYRAQFLYDNLQIQNNILHYSWKYGVKKLLFLGSSCIYPKLAPQPLQENALLTGDLEYTNEPYAIAKIAGMKLCEAYNLQYGTNFISVMPTNLYGPNDNYDLEKSHVLPAFIRKIHLAKCLENNDWQGIYQDFDHRPVEGITGGSGEEKILRILEKYGIVRTGGTAGSVTLTLWGTGRPLREFMHTDDLARACVYLMQYVDFDKLAEPYRGKEIKNTHINIGTGKELPIKELAEAVKRIVGFRGTIIWDASKPDGTPRKLLDISKLKALGFTPEIDLEEGVRRTYVEWKGEE